jgi:hypothetical protein
LIVHADKASDMRCCVTNCGVIRFRQASVKAPHPQTRGATVDTVANVQEQFCAGMNCMGWVWINFARRLGMCGAKAQADSIPLEAMNG